MTRISELPLATTPLTGGELVPVVQSGVTSQVSVDNLTTGKSISVAGISVTGTTASGSGLVLAPTLVRLNADRTKTTNNTSLEGIFDAANDTLALAANTLYYFRGTYLLGISAISTGGSYFLQTGFIFSNTPADIYYTTLAWSGSTSNASQTSTIVTSASATSISPSSTFGGVNYNILIEGWFKSNATTGGTVVPAFTQTAAGTSVGSSANAGSWLMVQPMSANPSATLLAGNWS